MLSARGRGLLLIVKPGEDHLLLLLFLLQALETDSTMVIDRLVEGGAGQLSLGTPGAEEDLVILQSRDEEPVASGESADIAVAVGLGGEADRHVNLLSILETADTIVVDHVTGDPESGVDLVDMHPIHLDPLVLGIHHLNGVRFAAANDRGPEERDADDEEADEDEGIESLDHLPS
jgi:hypothetical protein